MLALGVMNTPKKGAILAHGVCEDHLRVMSQRSVALVMTNTKSSPSSVPSPLALYLAAIHPPNAWQKGHW